MEGRRHGDLEALRQMELKRTIDKNPGAQDPDTGGMGHGHGRILTPALVLHGAHGAETFNFNVNVYV